MRRCVGKEKEEKVNAYSVLGKEKGENAWEKKEREI